VVSAVVLGTGIGVVLRVVADAGLPVVAGAILLFALAGYITVNVPSRRRVHSWGQVQQALDNNVGIFGKSYPEDLVRQPRARKVGRNDPCPCGSGQKFKRCCGATSEAS